MSEPDILSLQKEIGELRDQVNKTDGKIQRLLNWAEEDTSLGKPSISHQIDNLERQVRLERNAGNQLRQDYEVLANTVSAQGNELKNVRASSGIAGAGGGTLMSIIVNAAKSIFS